MTRIVSTDDLGQLISIAVNAGLQGSADVYSLARKYWSVLEPWDQRHIITDIEVAIAMDSPERYNPKPLPDRKEWVRFVADLRPPKAPFTIDYHCHKCKARDVKLVPGWLPAVPVDDTYWGYTSVPSADVEWWRALPSYPPGEKA